jgi:hypothetical protein
MKKQQNQKPSPEQNSVMASNHSFACNLLITIHTFERRGEQARKNRK